MWSDRATKLVYWSGAASLDEVIYGKCDLA